MTLMTGFGFAPDGSLVDAGEVARIAERMHVSIRAMALRLIDLKYAPPVLDPLVTVLQQDGCLSCPGVLSDVPQGLLRDPVRDHPNLGAGLGLRPVLEPVQRRLLPIQLLELLLQGGCQTRRLQQEGWIPSSRPRGDGSKQSTRVRSL